MEFRKELCPLIFGRQIKMMYVDEYLSCMTHHPQYGSPAARQHEHVTYLLHSCTGNLYTCQYNHVC